MYQLHIIVVVIFALYIFLSLVSGVPFDTHLTDNAIRVKANRDQYGHLTKDNLQHIVNKFTMTQGN
jgi:hypothetical protein